MIKLYRDVRRPQTSRAVLRDDGVHFLTLEGNTYKEESEASYPSLEAMNRRLRNLGFSIFEIVKTWPPERKY